MSHCSTAVQRVPRRKSTVFSAPRITSSKSARCTVRWGAPNWWRNAPRRMREMIRPLRQLRMTRKSDSQPRAMTACRELDPGKRSVAPERLASRLAHQVGGAPGDDDVANALKYALSSARGGAVSSFLELVLALERRAGLAVSSREGVKAGSARHKAHAPEGAARSTGSCAGVTTATTPRSRCRRDRRAARVAHSRAAGRKFSPKHRRNSSSSNILSGCCEIIS